MPCITLPYDPAVGPILTIGITAPSSLAAPGSSPPTYKFIKGLVDSGCSNIAIAPATAKAAGLIAVSKTQVVSTTQTVTADVHLGDLALPYHARGATQHFYFKDVRFTDFLHPNPNFEALIGRDVLGMGTLFLNGHTNQFTFCW
jgi:hypothetical protein